MLPAGVGSPGRALRLSLERPVDGVSAPEIAGLSGGAGGGYTSWWRWRRWEAGGRMGSLLFSLLCQSEVGGPSPVRSREERPESLFWLMLQIVALWGVLALWMSGVRILPLLGPCSCSAPTCCPRQLVSGLGLSHLQCSPARPAPLRAAPMRGSVSVLSPAQPQPRLPHLTQRFGCSESEALRRCFY